MTEDNDGKVPGMCFFLIPLTEFQISEDPIDVEQRYDNSQRSSQSKTGPDVFSLFVRCEAKPGQLCAERLWTHEQPLCSSQPPVKQHQHWVTEPEDPQTANMFLWVFDSCGCWRVVHLMWFMTNFCSSRLACIIWCGRVWDRRSSRVTPAPSSPLWTWPCSAFPKQSPHRGERQRSAAAPHCWSWGVIAAGPFGL